MWLWLVVSDATIIRQHRMRDMRTGAIDDPWCLSVCLSRLRCAKNSSMDQGRSWGRLLGAQGTRYLVGVAIAYGEWGWIRRGLRYITLASCKAYKQHYNCKVRKSWPHPDLVQEVYHRFYFAQKIR